MTRDYNKQRRDDTRPFSRPQPSNRPGEERSPRAARPRLNRETVDRAWESGAPSNHADDRTRSNGPAPRGNWRNNQQTEHSPAPHNRPSYGNRSDNNRRFERTPDGNQPRSRSYNEERNFNDRRSNDRPRYSGGPGARPGPGYRDNAGRPNGQPRFDERNQGQGYQRRDSERYDRPGRDSERDTRSPRQFERGNRSPRDYDRAGRSPREDDRESRPSRYEGRNNRFSREAQGRNTTNPRWQSRPTVQRENFAPRQPDSVRRETQPERFEGDYERFNTSAPPSQPVQQPEIREEERHVTQLPDGRVLKGPRPVQRKNAQFWTGISQDTEALVSNVEVPAAEPVEEAAPTGEEETPKPRKPRTRTANAVTRGKKSEAAVPKKRTRAPGGGPLPRPSRKGHKWPTPE